MLQIGVDGNGAWMGGARHMGARGLKHLIYKSKHGVRLSVATKTRRGPETSEVLKTFEDLNRGVCLSVTTNSAGQGRAAS